MSRWWTELVAAFERRIPLPLLLLLLFVAATAVAALWYFFPAWVPRRLPRLRRPRRPGWWGRWPSWRWPSWRLRWRRRRPPPAEPVAEEVEPVADGVPEIASADVAGLADRLAAEGRYAEAVRERLRAMVRELIEGGVLAHQPGWTVTELAAVAADRRPAVAGPLGEAGRIFSEVWYGQRPAGAAEDAGMRELATALTAALRTPRQLARPDERAEATR